MQIKLTDFSSKVIVGISDKQAEVISDIIYDALCNRGISFDSFAFRIDVKTMEEE